MGFLCCSKSNYIWTTTGLYSNVFYQHKELYKMGEEWWIVRCSVVIVGGILGRGVTVHIVVI